MTMHVSMVFDPLPDLGPDPKDDTARQPRRLGYYFEGDDDFIIMHREWGGEFPGGSRTHVWCGGSWQHITQDQISAIIQVASDEARVVAEDQVRFVDDDDG